MVVWLGVQAVAEMVPSPAPDGPGAAAPALVPVVHVRTESMRAQLLSRSHARTLPPFTAQRRVGDAVLALVADDAVIDDRSIAAAGVHRDDVFRFGMIRAAAHARRSVRREVSVVAGARCEVVACDDPYAFDVVLAERARRAAGVPIVMCPLTWGVCVVIEIEGAAGADLVAAARAFVDALARRLDLEPGDRITTSLWWWPTGEREPEVIDEARPPSALVKWLRAR